jgi:hypothetical protein
MSSRLSGATPLRDDVFARGPRLRIFVSSQMRGGVLAAERAAAIALVRSIPFFEPWCWEDNAYASTSCSEEVCVGSARTSDGLLLILGDDLTPITEREYREAKSRGVTCMILVKEGVKHTVRAAQFLAEEQASDAVTVRFANISEFRSHITTALRGNVAASWRHDRERRLQRTVRSRPRIRVPRLLGRRS